MVGARGAGVDRVAWYIGIGTAVAALGLAWLLCLIKLKVDLRCEHLTVLLCPGLAVTLEMVIDLPVVFTDPKL